MVVRRGPAPKAAKRTQAAPKAPVKKAKATRRSHASPSKVLSALPRPSAKSASEHSDHLLFAGGLLLLVLAVGEGLILTVSVRSLRLSA